ncbi:phospholipase D-like domain-containing protein [Altererythrobacter sp. ZODW24]|uniref:phospholipase D-like domain-containing protein n=1 Tax=Altererythrobacter sp. ZODW24 TaxID=2185142 RepID=UPI001F0847F3|nr:phospholipase D-like domain-containing protein [Altererythrobacter sp. ZODW24]
MGKGADPASQTFDDASAEPSAWRYVHASRANVIVDAEDYFHLMQQAMLNARKRVLLIGWDFDTRIHLAQGRRWYQRRGEGKYPVRLGSFILWLTRHRPDLEVRILKWSYGFLKFFGRGSMMIDLARWWPNRRIDFKFDTAHPVACSHHQKIVVIDNNLAVCGGIDMTTDRWDTREHLEDDPRRKRPRGAQYGPWHDVTMMIEGAAASALGELGRDRWGRAGGKPLELVEHPQESAWPDDLKPQFENVEIGIARTRAEYAGTRAVNEVEQLFIKHISRAKRYIYAESQYFASRAIAECIARRMSEDDAPEVLIVNPLHADGWLEQQAMDNARARLVRSIGDKDTKGRFHIYHPFTGETPIYVHAKLMIVDDEIVRIGSANMNNRSMGLDSECDVFIDAARPGNEHAARRIASLRHSLLAEHLGLDEAEVPQLLEHYGSIASMIRHCPPNSRQLRPFQMPELNDTERAFADNAMLDPERPDEMFEMPEKRRGLFRKGSILRRPRIPFFKGRNR